MSFRPLSRFGPFGPCPFVPAVILSFINRALYKKDLYFSQFKIYFFIIR